MSKFKVGQKVVRTSGSESLVKGEVYFVTRLIGETGLNVSKRPGGFSIRPHRAPDRSDPEEFLEEYFDAFSPAQGKCGTARDRRLLCLK